MVNTSVNRLKLFVLIVFFTPVVFLGHFTMSPVKSQANEPRLHRPKSIVGSAHLEELTERKSELSLRKTKSQTKSKAKSKISGKLKSKSNGKRKKSARRLSPSAGTDPSAAIDLTIRQAAAKYGLEPSLIRAIIKAESEFDPRALSPYGAKGLMQLMPGTAAALGVKDLYCPIQNIKAGARHYKKLLTTFRGDHISALAAYNIGKVRVLRCGIPPGVRRDFVQKVLAYQRQYSRRDAATDSMRTFAGLPDAKVLD
ncbi:MAG: lytic transglycosylase domain-containing protein [Deltaproteobacteria bacterium]|nr:lytic transglycosylase domain-containing protein [Deltaproteobacteria bacterium]MBF0527071.1 lytic transglycosylase domain-containing protein [Deltaproteobacteria bacterium]